MAVKRIVMVAGAVLGSLWGAALSVASQVGPVTVPPSTYREVLTTSLNRLNAGGGLGATGSYFRGVAATTPVSDYRLTLGPATLDSFIRDTARQDSVRFFPGSGSYYWRQRAVTGMEPAQRRTVGSAAPGIGGRLDDRYVPGLQQPLLSGGTSPADSATAGNLGLRAPGPGVRGRAVQTKTGVESTLERLTDPVRSVRLRQFRGDVSQEELLTEDVREGLLFTESSKDSGTSDQLIETLRRVPLEGTQPRQLPEGLSTPEPGQKWVEALKLPEGQGDAIRQEVSSAIGAARGLSSPRGTSVETHRSAQDASTMLEQIKQKLDEMGNGASGIYTWSSVSKDGMSYRERAQSIMGPHQTFDSYTEARFREHMITGETYLKQGRYYRAASAYSMALAYEPDDAVALVGRSHSLFAAGEYMSSALFLSRALETTGKDMQQSAASAEQLKLWRQKFLLIDRDKLESRLVDLEKWQELSDSPELKFLGGYVYYQMGRRDRAKESLSEAASKMPDAEPVVLLKKIIDTQP